VIAQAPLVLTVQRNYGDTDIIIRAVDLDAGKTFYDPQQGDPVQVAVMRDGWVAYLCDLRADQEIKVKITIIEHPADVYLFKEVNFQTYKRNPKVTFVPFEAKGYEQGAIGGVTYSFTAQDTDRYYIVIDNKDWPMGTETEGPVDYTISIEPKWDIEGDTWWDALPGPTAVIAMGALIAVCAVAVFYRRRDM